MSKRKGKLYTGNSVGQIEKLYLHANYQVALDESQNCVQSIIKIIDKLA